MCVCGVFECAVYVCARVYVYVCVCARGLCVYRVCDIQSLVCVCRQRIYEARRAGAAAPEEDFKKKEKTRKNAPEDGGGGCAVM